MGFAISDMQLSSPAFNDGEAIPQRYTAEGEDTSPEFSWVGVPDGTLSFALICHDPDAPLVGPGCYGFAHWVLYNIAPSTRQLSAGTREHTAGCNDFDQMAYGGPRPPQGHGIHRYYFWLFALATDRPLKPGLTLWQLLRQIEPRVAGMNRLVGTCRRD